MIIKSTVSVFISLSLLLAGCSSKSGESSHSEEEHSKVSSVITMSLEAQNKINLKTHIIMPQSLTGWLAIPAHIIPDQNREAQVRSLVAGRVSQVFASLGDAVKKGDVLMEIESPEIGVLKAEYIKAQARLSTAAALLKRQKTLHSQGVAAEKTLIEAEEEFNSGRAEWIAADKKIHSVGASHDEESSDSPEDGTLKAEHTAGTLSIRAPIDGTVIERNVVIGQLVSMELNSFTIINTSSLWADGQVHEHDVASISGRSTVTIIPTSSPKDHFPGRILYIGETVDEASRTIKVRAEVQNPTRRLKPEMFAEMRIPLGKKQAIVVPQEALLTESGQSYLFIALSDTTFEKRFVVTGMIKDTLIEILSGLNPHDRIVITGAFELKSEFLKDTLGDDHGH